MHISMDKSLVVFLEYFFPFIFFFVLKMQTINVYEEKRLLSAVIVENYQTFDTLCTADVLRIFFLQNDYMQGPGRDTIK